MPHFEIHAADVDAAKSFYGGLFGWRFEPMKGGEAASYHLIEGRDIGQDKGVTAGIMARMGDAPAAGSPIRGGTMTFAVEDCDASYALSLIHI